MKRRRIGSLEVSVCGLGCNNFGGRVDEAGTRKVVDAAIAAGINFFDTADIYGDTLSEEYLGRAVGRRRQGVVIATKFGMEVDARRKGAHPDYVARAAEDSLRRLGTDYIDLYQIHEPDPAVPVADTIGALQRLVEQGKVRELGCSNFSAAQIRESFDVAGSGPRFVSVQNEYSLLDRTAEDEVLDECERLDLAFLPYFPLASGLLTGKYKLGEPPPPGSRLSREWAANRLTEERLAAVEQLSRFAESRGRKIAELAFSWLLSRESVASVIAGATTPEQVRTNAASVTWELSDAERAEVDRIVPPRTVVAADR